MSNLTALAELLSEQIQRIQRACTPRDIELGLIQADLSLRVDSLKEDIPQAEYLLNLPLTGLVGDALHTADASTASGQHQHLLPEALRGIRPNDRVLVLWAGNQPIVIAILATGKGVELDGR